MKILLFSIKRLIQCGGIFIKNNFQEAIIPSIWEAQTFLNKVGSENQNMMWRFQDKGNREVCLVPEITGIIQEMWRNKWQREQSRPMKLFYVSRCYRYERPQKGRYREFTQFGIEILGGKSPNDRDECIDLLTGVLNLFNIDYSLDISAKRGLSYYTEDGFEARVETLGAQKQIAGGGRYNEGIGWAIGVERLILAHKS